MSSQKAEVRAKVSPQAAAEGDGGNVSDEYSDDDDPGYRIVLVEDVGELYPDHAYRMRHKGGHKGMSASSKSASAAKEAEKAAAAA
eukprot:CAMPEP_0173454798 /NCGR_PEP_ID=MMETSP1357-20121228/53107_1 /TAXON_ID=77926 /ORGANISM="Hemiselmis rufescens, Strain PCC563" /LENGTH=85 /DNA_ID=CAMNT_0014421871 /DNA_START=43 /DNA_END=296 /DNA_ORIENTATION=+